jgi:hypothetical protein
MESTSLLDRWLEPVITPDVARRLVSLRPDPELTQRVLDLGAKASQGLLSPEESTEYEEYISANDFIAILQSKARQVLKRQSR